MADRSVDIAFGGNASGLIGAINASVSAMGRMEAQSKSFAGAIASTISKQIAPIATAVASAFVARKALQDFSNSNLPGASGFVKSIQKSNASLKALSESIGEFLAPSAAFAAKIIGKIADKLAPMIRVLTAFIASSSAFFQKLASNASKAFEKLMPETYKVFSAIAGMFGGETDWRKKFDGIRKAWNRAWQTISRLVAPVLVAISHLLESVVIATGEAFNVLFGMVDRIVTSLMQKLGVELPKGAGDATDTLLNLASVIQKALLTAVIAVDFAIINWRLSFKIAWTAAQLTVEQMKSVFFKFASYGLDVFETLGANIGTTFRHYVQELIPVFATLGDNIAAIMSGAWDVAYANFIVLLKRIGTVAANPAQFLRAIVAGFGDVAFGALDTLLPMQQFQMPNLTALPQVKGVPAGALKGIPGMQDRVVSDEEKKLQNSLDNMKSNFGDGFAKALQDGIKNAHDKTPALINNLGKKLPFINVIPDARVPAAVSHDLQRVGPGGAAGFMIQQQQFRMQKEHLDTAKMTHSEIKGAREDQRQARRDAFIKKHPTVRI